MDPDSEYSIEEWLRIDQEFIRLQGTVSSLSYTATSLMTPFPLPVPGQHYLDHAGATLYSSSQIDSIADDLKGNVYANPHTSKETEDLIDQVRYRVLQFFNTSSADYQVIFNRGATDGLKSIAECFDFGRNGQFVHLRSCHTSVLGMRETVRTDRISPVEVEDLQKVRHMTGEPGSNSLLVYPAQCNFNGFKYDLGLIEALHQQDQDSNWFVCLDAAAFVSTSYLDLSKYQPDFVVLSFYKLFGYPTGLGALLVSRRGEGALAKRYYGGGTVLIAMSGSNFHQKRYALQDHFQDGTLPFLSIISLLAGFKTIERLVPPKADQHSIQRIAAHTFQLGKYLFNELKKLRYQNGRPVVEFYTQSNYETSTDQGGVVTFNVLHSDGNYVGFSEFNCMAELHSIRLRVGCFCNPGACQRALRLTDDDLMRHYKSGHVCGDSVDLFNNVPTGAIRVSVGYMTRKQNVDALIEMIKKCYLNQVETQRVLTGDSDSEVECSDEVLLDQICVYPIKSCAPFRIFSQWEVRSRGLKYDREWMIINSNGVAVTQKMSTHLCLIRPLIDERRGVMRLTMRGKNPIEVPLKQNLDRITSGSLCRNSKVCGDRIQGFDCGDSVAEWLDRVLSLEGLRLIRQDEEDKRFGKTSPESEISLNNSAQFLLINSTSVRWLMSHVDEYSHEMDNVQFVGGIVDRFRGNLIVSSKLPLEEKSWKTISLTNDEVVLDEAGPCTRCQMICIDQETGEKTTEPLRTIGRIFEGKIRFGMYFKQNRTNSVADDCDLRIIKCGSPICCQLNIGGE